MAIASGTLIASAAAGIGSAVVGQIAAAGDKQKAQDAMNAAYQQILSVGAPPDLSKEIIRDQLKQVGIYSPQLEDSITQETSKLSQIQEDPKLKDAQMQALQGLQQRGAQGLTAQERGAFNETRRNVEKEAESKRQQVIQNLAQRGLAGGGAEIAAQLGAAQSGDERLSAEGDRLAAAAAQNALQATAQAGQLGGQIRGQDFSVNSAKAQAADELNRFNVSNQIARQQRNVANENQAQQQNLATQQQISNYNTQQANEERLRQAQAQRQNWQDQMTAAQARAGALSGQGQYNQQQAQNTASAWQGVGQGISGAANSYGAQQAQNDLLTRLFNKKQQNNPGTPQI